ncbi:UNVERIFIED_CONTAM: hypothetical protein FKN15_062511 [Acipenser sinensis]
MPMREEFIEKIIIGQLDVNLEEILGIQRNGREKYLDVTMKCQTYFKKLMVKYMENEEVHPVNKFKVRSMERDNYRLITLNMFDMNIPDVAVDLFLVDYVEIVSGPRYRRDRFGVWNGQRQYEVLLKEDENGFEGFFHPPATFRIGRVKGYMVYSRQPQICRVCDEEGHSEFRCEKRKCLNCKELGHFAQACPKPKACNECGSTSHLFRACPNRSYASVARGQEERGSLRAKDEAVEGVQTQKALVSNSKETSKMLAPTKAVVLERDKRQAEEQGELKEGVSFTDSELARVLTPYRNDEEDEEPEVMEEENNGGSEGTVILDTNINKSSWGERVEELEEGEHSKWDKVPGKRKLIDIEEDIVPTYNRFESFLSEISDGTSGDSDGSVVSVIGGSQVSEESVGLEMEGSEVESSEAEGYLGNNGVEGFKGVIGFTEEKKEGKEETERKKKKEHE